MPAALYLTEGDRAILQELIRKGRAGRTSRRPVPTRRRPQSGGGTLVQVLITSSVSAASYSGGTLSPSEFTARLWLSDGAGGFTQSADDTKDCTNPYATAITISSGKGRVAWVTTSGRLVVADCTEITL